MVFVLGSISLSYLLKAHLPRRLYVRELVAKMLAFLKTMGLAKIFRTSNREAHSCDSSSSKSSINLKAIPEIKLTNHALAPSTGSKASKRSIDQNHDREQSSSNLRGKLDRGERIYQGEGDVKICMAASDKVGAEVTADEEQWTHDEDDDERDELPGSGVPQHARPHLM
ncbi:hypothetical protein BDN67DRAFT_983518 [Paxillus ammoniavirescens]|nr:hypothetical protein BDN67DRAFT_983518 [Paxillus ammoniavirescens]